MGAVKQQVFKCVGLWVAFCARCKKSSIRDSWEEAVQDSDEHAHGCKRLVQEVPC